MGIFEKANLIELTQEDLQDAKTTAGLFKDEFVKRRAFANVIAARSALKLLFSLNIEATNLYSMYSINKVLERLDIADVYAGSIRIDARLVDDASNIFIPKSHFELGITPDLYLILKLEKGMTGVEFLGCINPDEMDKSRENKDYYFVDEDLLYNLKIFKNLVKNNQGKQDYVPTKEDIERAENLIVPLEDGDIFNADYEFLMKQLAFNQELRKKTVEFENFEFVSQKVVTEETVYGDSVLGLVGSEKLYDRNEFSTDIDLEDLSESTVDDFVENFDETSAQIPEMNEFTGEISLDDALTQMDDNFELNQDNPEIIEMESNDDEHFQEKDVDEVTDNHLDNLINDVSEITDYSETEPLVETDEPLKMLDDSDDQLMSFDNMEDEVDEPLMPISSNENLEPMIIEDEDEDEDEDLPMLSDENANSYQDNVMSFDDEDADEDEDEFSNNQQEQGLIESLPELDEDEIDDDDLDFSSVDENAPINFEDGEDIDLDMGELPDLDGFSLDDTVDEEETSEIEESLKEEDVDNEEESDELPLVSMDDTSSQKPHEEKEIKPFEDDDVDMADLPTLKVFEENEETYQKKMYKAPAIDDIDMKNVNLDDFDDYENEDKEEEARKSQELEEMMSDLDSILNSENISLEGVEDILTDEELNESLKQIEEEQAIKEAKKREEVGELGVVNESYEENTTPYQENYQEMEISENSPTLNQEQNDVAGEESEQNESMSLDDFLNSSFNDMSTNPENNANIDSNQSLDSIYQQEENRGMNSPLDDDNPDTLLTNEATMVDNSANLYNDDTDALNNVEKEKPKSRAPQLMVVLVIMMCACLYVNKDIIMDNLNIQFPSKPEEPAVPEFDLNSLKEPTPADASQDSPIPSIPQPTDMPDAPPATPAEPAPSAQAPAVPQAGAVPQNSSNKITKLSWEVPENMANNQKIRKYLQIAGRTLKLSLQNDLLVATELPFSNRVMIDLRIAPSGNLISSDFVISSGSKQIDNIVLQSVKDTLKYVRPPMGEIQSPNSNFTLIINF